MGSGRAPAVCSRASPSSPGVTFAELAVQIRTPASNLGPILSELTSRGLVSMPGGGEENIAPLSLTERGQAALERLRGARRDDLAELLEGWSPFRHPELAARLEILAWELIDQDAEKLHQFAGNGPADHVAAPDPRSREGWECRLRARQGCNAPNGAACGW